VIAVKRVGCRVGQFLHPVRFLAFAAKKRVTDQFFIRFLGPPIHVDARPRHHAQPRFERTAFRIVLEVGHPAGEVNECVLHHVLRLGISEAGFARDVVNEPPVSVEEIAPARLILPITQAPEQTLARGQKCVAAGFGCHVGVPTKVSQR